MVLVLAKSGQVGGLILSEDVKTCKKKSFYRILTVFRIYTVKHFFCLVSSYKIRNTFKVISKCSPVTLKSCSLLDWMNSEL